MRVVHGKALRRDWSRIPGVTGVILDRDICIKPRGRLHMKLMVFATVGDMRRFWKRALGYDDLGARVRGAVNALATEWTRVGRAPVMECDPRYFCLMALTKRHLRTEIVAHESTHAAFCYAKRRKGDMWAATDSFDEESIAYPTGIIVSLVTNALYEAKLWQS